MNKISVISILTIEVICYYERRHNCEDFEFAKVVESVHLRVPSAKLCWV